MTGVELYQVVARLRGGDRYLAWTRSRHQFLSDPLSGDRLVELPRAEAVRLCLERQSVAPGVSFEVRRVVRWPLARAVLGLMGSDALRPWPPSWADP